MSYCSRSIGPLLPALCDTLDISDLFDLMCVDSDIEAAEKHRGDHRTNNCSLDEAKGGLDVGLQSLVPAVAGPTGRGTTFMSKTVIKTFEIWFESHAQKVRTFVYVNLLWPFHIKPMELMERMTLLPSPFPPPHWLDP